MPLPLFGLLASSTNFDFQLFGQKYGTFLTWYTICGQKMRKFYLFLELSKSTYKTDKCAWHKLTKTSESSGEKYPESYQIPNKAPRLKERMEILQLGLNLYFSLCVQRMLLKIS